MTTNRVFELLALPVFLLFSSAQAATTVGGFNIDGYATSLDGVSPTLAAMDVVTTGGTLADVSTDQSVDSFAQLPGGSSSFTDIVLTLGFAGTVVNGAGNDLVLFEIGTPDTFSLTINSTNAPSVATLDTGFTVTGGAQLNAALVDLSDFGVADGAFVSSIDVGLAKGGATFAMASTLAPVPVPAAVWLFGSGLVGLAGVARKRA